MDGAGGLGGARGRTIAVIGGGFTGACLALHLARAAPDAIVMVFEPRPVLGLGLAYSTTDDSHRLNARAQRMSLYPDDPGHFCRWLAETGAGADDAEAALADGRLFPRRAVFGAYVAAHLAPLVRDGRIRHVRSMVEAVEQGGSQWRIRCGNGAWFAADAAVLATGHAPPAIPAALRPVAAHAGFIADPWRPGWLAGIGRRDDVLIVGTGLTMADAVASLDRAGHEGGILAISRRGQMPREHAGVDRHCDEIFAAADSARGLLRDVRKSVARAAASGIAWQCVFDGLRGQAQYLWDNLPDAERHRLLRHARPFWETHRHRLPPPTAAVLRRRMGDGTLRVEAASIIGAADAGGRIEVELRGRGERPAVRKTVDAVVLTSGPGRVGEAPGSLLATLLDAGLVAVNAAGQGLNCDRDGRVTCRGAAPPLFMAGPLTRGVAAEIISVPEIARQVAEMAAGILDGVLEDAMVLKDAGAVTRD